MLEHLLQVLHMTVHYRTLWVLYVEVLGMRTLNFTDLRQNASRVLDLVEKGQTIEVLRHGKAIARIIPAEVPAPAPAWKRPGLRLVASGANLSQAILHERRSGH